MQSLALPRACCAHKQNNTPLLLWRIQSLQHKAEKRGVMLSMFPDQR